MINTFKNTLSQITYLTDSELSQIAEITSVKELNTGEFWFYEGMLTKKVAYIYKGYLRKYYIINGDEKTDYFYFDNSFTGDLPSIIEQSPCKSFNIAMKPTTLITLSYSELNELSKKNHNIEHMIRMFLEQGFVAYYNKATSFILQTPKERYEQLISSNPLVLQRATQYHIASYLGITPQHLSRLRGQK
jgi:CRP-like cAMP-binding protein